VKILDTDHCIALLPGILTLQGRVDPTEELAVIMAHGIRTANCAGIV
jgi:hypothetical protein